MTDNNPFLFVHLPLNELRGDRLLDSSANRQHALAHATKISADETFGACLEFSGVVGSFVEFPPLKLNPGVFLPGADERTLTFSTWISAAAAEKEWTVIDCGFRPELQRLQVKFRKTTHTVAFTVAAPSPSDQRLGFTQTDEAPTPQGAWLHFALVWIPQGEGVRAGQGTCQMYLNGRVFASSFRSRGEVPARLPNGSAFQTVLGWPSFSGKLAHFRIYSRALSQEEIVQEIDRDLASLRHASPVDCSLIDPRGRPMMFLNFSDIGEKMQVILKPSQSGLTLTGLPPGPPTPDRCHLELAFRPGTLDLSGNPDIAANTTDRPGHWEAKAYPRTSPDGHDSVCIRCHYPRELSSDLTIVLSALRADGRLPGRWTLVEIRYRNWTDSRGQMLSGRIPQWLQLAPASPRTSLVGPIVDLGEGWLYDPPDSLIGPGAGNGIIWLYGHVYCDRAQEQMQKPSWRTLTQLPTAYAPFSAKELRFPGRVRWSTSDGPPAIETLWSSDLIVAPDGVVSIAADPPPEVLRAVGRMDVYLDGVSYSNERLGMTD